MISFDGVEIDFWDCFVYKVYMFEDVFNLFWCVGYMNVFWMLCVDMMVWVMVKLLVYMVVYGYMCVVLYLGDELMDEKLFWDI